MTTDLSKDKPVTNQFKFLDAFAPLFYSDKTYFLISSGRAAGKSTNCAAYLLLKLMGEDYARIVVARYTQKSIKSSIYRDIQDLIEQWNLGKYLEITGDSITNKLNGNQMLTHAFRLSDLTQTAKGKGIANPNYLFIDEFTEVDEEEEYLKLIDSFRMKGVEKKIIMAFNPTSKASWIFKRWYLPDGTPNPKWKDTHEFLHLTYLDNKQNLDPAKILEWEKAKVTDPDYYTHHILGHWTEIGQGAVYKNWKFEWEPDQSAEILYGLDFGFSNDPTAMVRVHKRGKRLWVEELIYDKGLTNEDIYDRLQKLGVPKLATIFADAAEPKTIETLRRLGYVNVRAASKGPDSVRAGIDNIKTYEVNVNPESKNLIEEYYQYSYRSGTDKPIDAYNHLHDALRYAMSSDKGETPQYAFVGKGSRPWERD